MASLEDLRESYRQFTEEREWGQFHDPKSLLLALVGEVGELAELFQWIPADEAVQRTEQEPLKTRTAEEIADVFIYLVGLADVLGIDLLEAAQTKLNAARAKFPAKEYRGTAPDRSVK
ncbi:MAG: nucleotide pyrophosphohydrolase [Pseudonocardiaceae bacterium]